MVTSKTCPHDNSSTSFERDPSAMLSQGQRPPMEFTRPEVADILIEAARADNREPEMPKLAIIGLDCLARNWSFEQYRERCPT